jgi:hypothetical protein
MISILHHSSRIFLGCTFSAHFCRNRQYPDSVVAIFMDGTLAIAKDNPAYECPDEKEASAKRRGNKRKRHGANPRISQAPRHFDRRPLATDVQTAHSVRLSRHSMPYVWISTGGRSRLELALPAAFVSAQVAYLSAG